MNAIACGRDPADLRTTLTGLRLFLESCYASPRRLLSRGAPSARGDVLVRTREQPRLQRALGALVVPHPDRCDRRRSSNRVAARSKRQPDALNNEIASHAHAAHGLYGHGRNRCREVLEVCAVHIGCMLSQLTTRRSEPILATRRLAQSKRGHGSFQPRAAACTRDEWKAGRSPRRPSRQTGRRPPICASGEFHSPAADGATAAGSVPARVPARRETVRRQ
jgi:hypothetical protein